MNNRFIKIISVFLVLASLMVFGAPVFFATAPNAPANASFSMETDASAVRAKDIIMLTVTLSNNSSKDIYKLEFSLTYDETRILGITPDYTTSINGMVKPNDQSPVVLRQQGSTIKVYNFNPTDTSTEPTPLKSGQKLVLKFPMVVSETATTGSISFSISDVSLKDSNSNVMTADICPNASVSVLPASNDATLSAFEVAVNNAPLVLTPSFSPNVTEYTVTVGYSIPSFSIKVTCSDDRATYSIIDRPTNDMLSVGTNVYKYLVTAEDKVTTRVYTLTIRRLAAGETTTASTTLPTSTTTAPTTTEPPTTTTTAIITTVGPSTTPPTTASTTQAPRVSASDTVSSAPSKEGSTITLNLASLLGIVAAAVALFLLAFSAGYITHKNATQPQKYSVDELMAAQEKLDLQNRLAAQQNDNLTYQPIYPSPSSDYNSSNTASTYTPPTAPSPAPVQPTYPAGGFGGYQQEMPGGFGDQGMYSPGEFNPQPVSEFGGYGAPTDYGMMPDFAQPVDMGAQINGAPTEFGSPDSYYYQ